MSDRDDEGTGLGWLARAAVAVLVPRELRESFEGDLLEELPLHGRPAAARRWAWGQIVRSAPALLAQQVRSSGPRRTVPLALVILVPSLVQCWLADVLTTPVHAAATIALGVVLLSVGVFFTTPGMRSIVLATGVTVVLIGQAQGGGAIGEGFYLIYLLPGFVYSNAMSGARRRGSCRRLDDESAGGSGPGRPRSA